jgi:predicted nucleotidyltransferase
VGDWDVDLFVAKRRYDEVCLARAVPVELGGILVKVVTPEDLLIHKLIKLRTDRRRVLQDLADLRALLEERGETLDWSYLRQWLPEDERELAESLASLDDEAILARLLRR